MLERKIICTLEEGVKLPKYESVGASGMDLAAWKYSLVTDIKTQIEFPYTLKPLERILVKTGLHIELNANEEAQIRPRSGLALKNGISIVNTPGTIDEDYRGDIGVILINLSNEDFTINKGDRIAQMVFARVDKYDLKVTEKLNDTKRSEGGFGSSGV
jgi:dUTP pyrophosphatase